MWASRYIKKYFSPLSKCENKIPDSSGICDVIQKGLPLISEIRAGLDHNLAVDRMGNLYGWGSNSNLQISHE